MSATASRCHPSIASPRFSAFDWEPSVADTLLPLIDVIEGGLASASRSPAKNKLYSFGIRPGLYSPFGNVGVTAPEAEAATAKPAAELCRRKERRFSFKLTDCIAVCLSRHEAALRQQAGSSKRAANPAQVRVAGLIVVCLAAEPDRRGRNSIMEDGASATRTKSEDAKVELGIFDSKARQIRMHRASADAADATKGKQTCQLRKRKRSKIYALTRSAYCRRMRCKTPTRGIPGCRWAPRPWRIRYGTGT